MKRIEELAEVYSWVWRSPIEPEDLKTAYEAGFRKAREMAFEKIGTHSLRAHDFHTSHLRAGVTQELLPLIKNLGEEEV